MKKFYCWKVLTEDGLLKDHRSIGPHYNQDSFNDYYESEEVAIKAYEDFKSKHDYSVESEMVLITVYNTWRD